MPPNRRETIEEEFKNLCYDKNEAMNVETLKNYFLKNGPDLEEDDLDFVFASCKKKDGNIKIEDLINKLSSLKMIV